MTNNANHMEINIDGLEVFAHHGWLPEEREHGQLFRFDLRLTLTECLACSSDDIASTVDYAAVIDLLVAAATARTYFLLEKLAAVLAEMVINEFPVVDRVWIRVTKPSPPIPHSVDGVSVSLERIRGGEGSGAIDPSSCGRD
ncbi:MAG: dihydroneopterin aldolase [Thermoleophilia bacterium]|nr:dihydroneopterin aldolase [Thermoleophilia bacterium]